MAVATQTPSLLAVPTPTIAYRPLLWFALAAAAGIVADSYLGVGGVRYFLVWWTASALALACALVARKHRNFALATAFILLAAAVLAGGWRHWRWHLAPGDDLARFALEAPEPACVEAIVVEPIRRYPPEMRNPLRALPSQSRSETTLELVRIRDGDQWRSAAGHCRLRVDGELFGPDAGDTVLVYARLARPPQIANPGEYDWAAVEQAAGRRSELYTSDPACVTVIRAADWTSFRGALDRARQWCERELAAVVGPRDEPLALAVLLGSRDKLDHATIDAFVETGAIHFLVVSGSNLAMLAAIVWGLGRLLALRTRTQLSITLAAVLVYAGIVGPEPPVVRAAIIAVAALAAISSGRRGSAGNLLAGAALIVLAVNPSDLFGGGTQLSFLSVAALILAAKASLFHAPSDPLDRLIAESASAARKLTRAAGRHSVQLVVASAIVWLAAAPLVAYHFHIATPGGILLTPIIWPLIGLALAASFGALTIGWLIPPLGALLGALCGECLHLTDLAVKAASAIPAASWYCAAPPVWWLVAFYALAALWVIVPQWRPNWRWQASAAALWIAFGYCVHGAGRIEPGVLRASFLSVGHGTCVVFELPSGQTILYDAGALASPELVTNKIAGFLWHRQIDRIDQLVLSHADIDHYNAVPGIVERFDVGVVYYSPMMFDPLATGGNLTAPNYLREQLVARGVPTREIWSGDRLPTFDDAVVIEVLHPPREGVMGRDNANSIVLDIAYAGRRILLPGDLESPGLELVMNDPATDCDILLAPHHGSDASDPPGFAAWCTPEEVVMSGRRPSRTLESVQSYERAGATVRHTAHTGAVLAAIDATGNVKIENFR